MTSTSSTAFLEVPEAYYRQVFRWLWRTAIFLGLCFGIAATFWPQYDKPLIAVPIIAAAVGGLTLGWIGAGRNRQELFREFTSNFWLRLQTSEKERDITAIDVFEHMVPDASDRRKVHRIRTAEGDVYLLHVQRFVELLVSQSMDDADRATDHALAVAWSRCVGELRPDLEPILSKTFRETFKADIAGHLVTIIHRSGTKLINELSLIGEREGEITTEAGPFKLEPMTPTMRTPRGPGRPRR